MSSNHGAGDLHNIISAMEIADIAITPEKI